MIRSNKKGWKGEKRSHQRKSTLRPVWNTLRIELKGLLYLKWETKPSCHETVRCLFLALIFLIQFYQSACSTSVRGWMGVDAYMRAVVVYVRVCVCVHVCMCVRVCAFVLLCFCEHCACMCVCLGEFVHVWGWSFKGEWEQLKLERKRERTSVCECMWVYVTGCQR